MHKQPEQKTQTAQQEAIHHHTQETRHSRRPGQATSLNPVCGGRLRATETSRKTSACCARCTPAPAYKTESEGPFLPPAEKKTTKWRGSSRSSTRPSRSGGPGATTTRGATPPARRAAGSGPAWRTARGTCSRSSGSPPPVARRRRGRRRSGRWRRRTAATAPSTSWRGRWAPRPGGAAATRARRSGPAASGSSPASAACDVLVEHARRGWFARVFFFFLLRSEVGSEGVVILQWM